MKQMIKIIRKVDIEKQYLRTLELELDYFLASLYYAMQQKNEKEILEWKIKLKQLHREIEYFRASVQFHEARRGKQ